MKAAPKKAGAKKAPDKPPVKKAAAKKEPAKKAARALEAPTPIPAGLSKKIGPKIGSKKLTKLAPLIASMVAPAASEAGVLDRLFAVITERRTADPATSHSARLLGRGMPKVAQKFGEEAVECLIEAVSGNKAELVAESADVLYHLLVMWVAAGVAPAEVWAELARREGVSGIAEKAARARPLGTTKIP